MPPHLDAHEQMTQEQSDVASTEDAKDTTGERSTRAKARSGDPRTRAQADAVVEEHEVRERKRRKAQKIGNPSWFVPVLVGLMLLGLLWVGTFYITQQEYPIPSLGQWNLAIGFGLAMAGFAMTTRWK